MAVFPRAFYKAATPADRCAEAVWSDCSNPNQLYAADHEIMIPFNLAAKMGQANVVKLANRLSVLMDSEVLLVRDETISSFRIVPSAVTKKPLAVDPMQYDVLSHVTREALKSGQAARPAPKSQHVPRPANAWILYRQHHHASTTALNPGLSNNDISRLIASLWRSESEETRQYWYDVAAQVKAQHAIDYPDYQYSPRRPGEKPTRRSRVRTDAVPFINDTPRGEQRVLDSASGDGTNPFDFENQLHVDDELMRMMSDNDILEGPNGIEMSYPLVNEFENMVHAQVQRAPIETLRSVSLVGTEFGSSFSEEDMHALLRLD